MALFTALQDVRPDQWDTPIPLSHDARLHLALLPAFLHLQQGRPFHPSLPTMTCDVDASRTAGGGILYTVHTTHMAQHYFTATESQQHINILELFNALLTLAAFLHFLTNSTILLRLDNQVAKAYIDMHGGRKPHLQQLAAHIHALCIKFHIVIQTAYLPSALMTADPISRYLDPEDFKLNPTHFTHFLTFLDTHHLPRPQIDTMATALNAQLPNFCSRFHHYAARHIDFFSIQWATTDYTAIWCNPPFSCITKVLAHLSQAPPPYTYLLTPDHQHHTPAWDTWLKNHAPSRLTIPIHPHTFTTLPNKHVKGHLPPTFPLHIYILPSTSFSTPNPTPIHTIPVDSWTTMPH